MILEFDVKSINILTILPLKTIRVIASVPFSEEVMVKQKLLNAMLPKKTSSSCVNSHVVHKYIAQQETVMSKLKLNQCPSLQG